MSRSVKESSQEEEEEEEEKEGEAAAEARRERTKIRRRRISEEGRISLEQVGARKRRPLKETDDQMKSSLRLSSSSSSSSQTVIQIKNKKSPISEYKSCALIVLLMLPVFCLINQIKMHQTNGATSSSLRNGSQVENGLPLVASSVRWVELEEGEESELARKSLKQQDTRKTRETSSSTSDTQQLELAANNDNNRDNNQTCAPLDEQSSLDWRSLEGESLRAAKLLARYYRLESSRINKKQQSAEESAAKLKPTPITTATATTTTTQATTKDKSGQSRGSELLELPRPVNVTVLIISWYPPILKLSWNLNELNEIDSSKLDFYEKSLNQSAASWSKAFSNESGRASRQEETALQQTAAEANKKRAGASKSSPSALSGSLSSSVNGHEFDLELALSKTQASSSSTQQLRPQSSSKYSIAGPITHEESHFALEGVATSSPTLNRAGGVAGHTLTDLDSLLLEEPPIDVEQTEAEERVVRELRLRRLLIGKTLTCFQVTYNIINSRFKIIEEYPPYLRSITMERLLPATEYSLHVVAVYLNKYKLFSERVQFVSPTDNESRRFKEGTYRPIHRYPDEERRDLKIGLAQVRSEELAIVGIALVFWIATICLFFNKWGKIRMLEPYQPAYRESSTVSFATPTHHPSVHNLLAGGTSITGVPPIHRTNNSTGDASANGSGVTLGSLAPALSGAKISGVMCGAVGGTSPALVSMACPGGLTGSSPPGELYHRQHQLSIGSITGLTSGNKVNSTAATTTPTATINPPNAPAEQFGLAGGIVTTPSPLLDQVGVGPAIKSSQQEALLNCRKAAVAAAAVAAARTNWLAGGRKRFDTMVSEDSNLRPRTEGELNYLFQTKAQALAKATKLWSKQQREKYRQKQFCSMLNANPPQDEFDLLRRTGQVASMLRQRGNSPNVSAGLHLSSGQQLAPLTQRSLDGTERTRPQATLNDERLGGGKKVSEGHEIMLTNSEENSCLASNWHINNALKHHRQSQTKLESTPSHSSSLMRFGGARSFDRQSGQHESRVLANLFYSNTNQQKQQWQQQQQQQANDDLGGRKRGFSKEDDNDEQQHRLDSAPDPTTTTVDEALVSANKMKRLLFMNKTHQHHHLATSTSSSTLIITTTQSGLNTAGGIGSNNNSSITAQANCIREASTKVVNSVSLDMENTGNENPVTPTLGERVGAGPGMNASVANVGVDWDSINESGWSSLPSNMQTCERDSGKPPNLKFIVKKEEGPPAGQQQLRSTSADTTPRLTTATSNDGKGSLIGHHILIEPPSPPNHSKHSHGKHSKLLDSDETSPEMKEAWPSEEIWLREGEEQQPCNWQPMELGHVPMGHNKSVELKRGSLLLTAECCCQQTMGANSSTTAASVCHQCSLSRHRRQLEQRRHSHEPQQKEKQFCEGGAIRDQRDDIANNNNNNWNSSDFRCEGQLQQPECWQANQQLPNFKSSHSSSSSSATTRTTTTITSTSVINRANEQPEICLEEAPIASLPLDDAFVRLASYTSQSSAISRQQRQSSVGGASCGGGLAHCLNHCQLLLSRRADHHHHHHHQQQQQQSQHHHHQQRHQSFCLSAGSSAADCPCAHAYCRPQAPEHYQEVGVGLQADNYYYESGEEPGLRPRMSSVFVASPYSRAHRDSFAMLRALSQKKSKSAEDVAYLSSLVLQIWSRDINPLLQSASQQQLSHANRRQSQYSGAEASPTTAGASPVQEQQQKKRQKPRSSLNVAHFSRPD